LILSPGWIGFFAFRESFALRLAILRPTLLPLGGTAGTGGESRFYKLKQGAAVVAIDERLSSGEPNVASTAHLRLSRRRARMPAERRFRPFACGLSVGSIDAQQVIRDCAST
jgi:hypothetical protein